MTTMNTCAEHALYREDPPQHEASLSSRAATDAALEFGRLRVLLRRRQLVADGVPIELGTRAFDLLLVLLQADGSLVTKDELMSRVWPGIVVAEENLKVQISALRKALGEDRDFIRTEFGRGYRFTATVRSTAPRNACQGPTRRRDGPTQRLVPQWISRRTPHGWCTRDHAGRSFDPAATRGVASCRDWICSAARKAEEARHASLNVDDAWPLEKQQIARELASSNYAGLRRR